MGIVQLRLGIVSKTATYWPYYVGLREGLFQRAGLTLDIELLGSTSAGVPALIEERVDVAATCPDVLIGEALASARLRIAGGLIDCPMSSLIVRPEVRAFEDLRGRRVAVTEIRGSVSVFLRALLRRKGLAVGDYEQVVCHTTPAQVAALEEGSIEAAMLTHPFESRLLALGFGRLARVGDELGSGSFTTLNVRQGWTARPEWAALKKALRAVDGVLRDPRRKDDVLAALSEWSSVSEAELDEAYHIYAGSTKVLSPAGELDLSGLEHLLAWMAEDGIEVRPEQARDFLDDHAALR